MIGRLARVPRKLAWYARTARYQLDAHPFDSPPEWVKRDYICEWMRRANMRTFVETGTYLGGTAKAVAGAGDYIVHTVEVDGGLYEEANRRLSGAKNVRIYHGSTLTVLPKLLSELPEPALFWLDAHARPGDTEYSKLHDIPTLREIELVLSHRLADKHVILIDDARFFTGSDGYPSVRDVIRVNRRLGKHELSVHMDIMHLYPLEAFKGA